MGGHGPCLEYELDTPLDNLCLDLFQTLAGTRSGNAVPVVNIKQGPMGRTHDVGFLKIQEFTRFEVQRATDMRAGIDVDKNAVPLTDHQNPASPVRCFRNKPV